MKRKMEKFVGIAMAVALVLALGMGSSYAVDEYSVAGGANNIQVTKNLDLKGATTAPDHTVTIKTTFVNTNSGRNPEGAVGDVVMNFSGSKTTETANIDFSTVTFKAPGQYTFSVAETISGSTQIKTTSGTATSYRIVVYVENDTSDPTNPDQLVVTNYYIYNSTGALTSSNKASSLTFSNEYDNYRLGVKKTVQGNFGDKSREFTIYPIFTGTKSGDKITVLHVSGTPKVNGTTVTSQSPVVLTSDAATTTSNWNITLELKDSDEVLIEGLRDTVKYRVREPSVPTGYTVSGTVESEKDIVSNNGTVVNIVNTYSQTVPSTGLFVNNWPYIAVVLVVLAGCIIFIHRRRSQRRYEEDL